MLTAAHLPRYAGLPATGEGLAARRSFLGAFAKFCGLQNSAASANFTARRSFLNASFAKSCGVPNAGAGESIVIRRSFPDAFARPWGLPNAVANLIAECSCKLRHSTQFLWYICQTLGSPNAVTSDGASWLGAVFPTHLPGPGGCRTQSQATGFHGSTQFLRCVCRTLRDCRTQSQAKALSTGAFPGAFIRPYGRQTQLQAKASPLA